MTPQKMPQRSAKEQFDRQASHYNAQWNRWSEESLNWLLAHSDCRETDIALDVATGTGFTALAFAPHLLSVVGLDVSAGMLAQARRRAEERGVPNVTFVEGAAEALPFPDAHFDLVTSRIAPHHFLSVERFLNDTHRVLKPGGLLLLADTSVPEDPEIGTWQNEVEALRDPSHVRNYTLSEWRQLVERSGLELEVIEDSPGSISLTLNDWLVKSGSTAEQSAMVRHRFETAPESAKIAFRIEPLDGDDIAFAWQRVALRARR